MAFSLKKYTYSILGFIALFAFILLPDVIFGFFNTAFHTSAAGKNAIIAMLLALFINFSASRRTTVFVITLCFLMQATQLAHFHYFGAFYGAFDIALMFKETRDVFATAVDIYSFLALPIAISFVFYLLALTVHLKFFKKTPKLPFLSVLFVIVLLVPFLQALSSDTSQKFQPNATHLSIKNSLYAVSYFAALEVKTALGYSQEMPEYKPYIIEEIETKKPNIVILMGESTSYLNMGIFGYERDTTPDLTSYLENPSYFQLPAISSAVSTRVSLALFYNLIYEPNNAKAVVNMEQSLYRLAKQQNYNTYYIATQLNAGGLVPYLSIKDIDVWLGNDDLSHYDGDYDNRLLLELKNQNIDFSQPNFITLHMRSAHGPYFANYPREDAYYPDENVSNIEYIVNTYDNSIRYTQKVIADIYEYFDGINEPVYIFFVPDHGETMGYEGRYGHNTVKLDSAQIPILFYGRNIKKKEMETVKNNLGCLTNHYLVGKEIARLMGYKVTNPNKQSDTFYMNGIDAFGEAGYMPYSMSEQREALCNNHQAIAR